MSHSIQYHLKAGPLSSHGRLLQLAARWPKTSRILEVGTAGGYLGRALRELGLTRVVGCERDPHSAQAARPYYQAHYCLDLEQETDVGRLGPCDVLLCADLLEHLRDPLAQLRRLSALVQPPGIVVISVPNVANWYIRLMVLRGRFDYADRGIMDRTHIRFFTSATLRRLVEDAGLSVERVYATPLPITYVLDGRVPGWVATGMERAYYTMSLCWRQLFAYQFVLVATRPAR